MGDAAGIGPEIIVKTFAAGINQAAVVYGDAGIIEQTINNLGLDTRFAVNSCSNIKSAIYQDRYINVINRWQALPDSIKTGVIDPLCGQGSYEYLCHAIDDAKSGHLRAIVTAPLNKAAMFAAGLNFPGHTEILAQRTNTTNYAMMLANKDLRVLLVTIHIALSAVASSITTNKELTAIKLAHLACLQSGIKQPRIAVAGLNPHAGEDGAFGDEEATIIEPAIKTARALGLNVSDPLPGDTVFMRARQGEFDIVVAQYHDQGLIPIKYLGLDNGVNVTVGLPFIRTSVDHGTAFNIAGQGIADPASLQAAAHMALAMTN